MNFFPQGVLQYKMNNHILPAFKSERGIHLPEDHAKRIRKMDHKPTECTAVPHTEQYHFRNHSKAFRCPLCGTTQRRNTNFLGQGALFCDGLRFSTVRTFADKRNLDLEWKENAA